MKLIKYKERNDAVESFIKDNGTIFHQYEFLKCIGTDYVCFAVVSDTNNEIIAVLPLVKTVKNRLKSYHIPPFAYQFGPVFNNDEAFYKNERIISLLMNELKNVGQLDFKMLIPDGDILAYKTNNFVIEANQTHTFDSNQEFGIDLLSKDKKRDVKKLIKLIDSRELSLIEDVSKAKPYILSLWKETSKRSKFDSHINILDKILKTNVPSYSNVILDNKGNAIAAAYCPYDKSTMYHLVGASIRSDDKRFSRANLLSLYYAILNANKLGLNFDFEGSNIPGVANFYRMMGGIPKINFRVQRTKSIFYNILKSANRIKQLYL